jgi:hypothetical protein
LSRAGVALGGSVGEIGDQKVDVVGQFHGRCYPVWEILAANFKDECETQKDALIFLEFTKNGFGLRE